MIRMKKMRINRIPIAIILICWSLFGSQDNSNRMMMIPEVVLVVSAFSLSSSSSRPIITCSPDRRRPLLSGGMLKTTSKTARTATRTTGSSSRQPVGDIYILDHLNINHEQGRHDWLTIFYFNFLQCSVDPRKEENFKKGRKTLWANIGPHQFHLPEGNPKAQVFEGIITLVYPNTSVLVQKYHQIQQSESLKGSLFHVAEEGMDQDNNTDNGYRRSQRRLVVTDPWGTCFHLIEQEEGQRNSNNNNNEDIVDIGTQPGSPSTGLYMQDLTIYTPPDCNLAGIGRFYQHVFNAPILEPQQQNSHDSDSTSATTTSRVVISVGPSQTLTFCSHPDQSRATSTTTSMHVDLRNEGTLSSPSTTTTPFLSNYGPHISMYVANLPEAYRKAHALGVVYVNPRFKRQAYTLEEAVDDCMFRCIDIIDPDHPNDGVILQLEHEIRSVIQRNGVMYKSCPLNKIPQNCKTLEA